MSHGTALHVALCLIMVLSVTGPAESQQTALPAELVSAYDGNGTVATYLRPGVANVTHAKVTFETEEQRLRLEWAYAIDDGASYGTSNAWRFDEHSLGYKPTALCRKAGVSTTFYVVGFIERSSSVIVEEWDVSGIVVGETLHPVTGELVGSSLSLDYSRSIVFVSNTVGPLCLAVYHHTSDRLWVLEEGAPNRLLEIDVASGSSSVLADGGLHPQLADMKSGMARFIEPTAPNGGGFYVILRPIRDWVPGDDLDESSIVYLARDEDFDGTVDDVTFTTWADMNVQVESDHADWRYH